MRIYVLRHGRTNYNDLGLCNGDPRRDVHLTHEGLAQAETAAEALRTVPLQRIYVSELPRTRQTADVINRCHTVPIEVHPALNDIVTGCEDRPVAEYQAAIAKDPLRCKVGSGESLLEYKERVLAFLDRLRDAPWETVAVVAHEETLRILYGHFHQLEDGQLPGLGFRNCQVLTFDT